MIEKMYAEYAWEQTETLLAIDSPSGYTAKAAAWVKEAFEKLGFSASITEKGVEWRERRPIPAQALELATELETRVCILKLVPGTDPKLLDLVVAAGYRGIIIEGFGAGGVPNDERGSFLPAIRRALDQGITIVCASQCIFDGVDLSRYPIGVLAARLGALSGGDKTVETLTVRLMQALKLCHTPEEIRAFMESPV